VNSRFLVSRSMEMVDFIRALFAKCWVNGTQEELRSLLRRNSP